MTSHIDADALRAKNMREQREAAERSAAEFDAKIKAERRAFKAAGGHAYPTDGDDETGMTLRDYFAGQALATIGESPNSPKAEAEFAYGMADAMLARRKVAPRTGDPDDR
jgi:hypothetical protein